MGPFAIKKEAFRGPHFKLFIPLQYHQNLKQRSIFRSENVFASRLNNKLLKTQTMK